MTDVARMSPLVGRGEHQAASDVFAAARERWLELSLREGPALPGADLSFIAALRERGRAAFAARGLPTARDDDWKYTHLGTLAATVFSSTRARPGTTLPTSTLVRETWASSAAARLIFANGQLDATASRRDSLPRGVHLLSMRSALREVPALVESILGTVANSGDHGFAALNAALWSDGYVLHVEPGIVLEAPLSVVLTNAAVGAEATTVRNLIVVEQGASVQVLEHYLGESGAPALVNATTEVRVGQGASLTHYKLEEEAKSAFHVSGLVGRVERDGCLISHLVAKGGAVARAETRVALAAEGARCELNGLYLPGSEQHIDCFTSIAHDYPHTTSTELYKGIVDGSGRGVWTGRVVVARDAQKTSAMQTNRNLLLSTRAHVDTRPQLEIYADDVKCSHGATVGRLDRDALFYLRSRGIDLEAARSVLTYAFVREVVAKIACTSLRSELEAALAIGMLGSGEVLG